MTAVLAPALLVVLLLGSALGGPRLLRRAAPALARTPRLATTMLTASTIVWLLAFMALGPTLAWATSGPSMLTGRPAEVCRRCIDAAAPFTGSTVEAMVPPALLLAVPVVGASVVVGAVVRLTMRRRRAVRATAQSVAAVARPLRLAGHQVQVVADPQPAAFALPRRQGGIVISEGAVRNLDAVELDAVLAHENAHLRQRHHAVGTLVQGMAQPFRWVPLVRAAADAIPHYFEIAADDAARRRAGTPALASALLKLSEPRPTRTTTGLLHDADHLLHAAGPDRIHHLVNPDPAPTGTGASLASLLNLTVLGVVGTSVFTVFIIGCA
ncbi:M56 family metallopeptidase [Haloactinopolyspora sp.]|uniref:M56 family metallopeptidase n=1 Tax=Haloactinopolyspora sp. TaxID=1966353 RepID=UPI002608C45A|nr:M56 family metallopeptidase [Haloactinopolyspora sp.]